MRKALRILALGIVVVGVVFWFFGGPNLGWTKTSTPVTLVDPVTEIEHTRWERNFIPGVDFLGGCAVLGALCFAASFLANPRNPSVDPL